MDRTRCWKCSETLIEGGCPACDASTVTLIREAINRAKEHADKIDICLASFEEKIKFHKAASSKKNTKDIGFAINTLCNIIDLLGEGNSHLISHDDLNEVREKSQQIIKCVEILRKINPASDEQTSQ